MPVKRETCWGEGQKGWRLEEERGRRETKQGRGSAGLTSSAGTAAAACTGLGRCRPDVPPLSPSCQYFILHQVFLYGFVSKSWEGGRDTKLRKSIPKAWSSLSYATQKTRVKSLCLWESGASRSAGAAVACQGRAGLKARSLSSSLATSMKQAWDFPPGRI